MIKIKMCGSEISMNFKIESNYKLCGDQPQAVDALVKSIKNGNSMFEIKYENIRN